MAAPNENSDIAQMFLDIENIGIDTLMLVLGAIEQEIWAKLCSFPRHIGNQYGGHQGSLIFGVIFLKLPLDTIEHLCKVSCFLQKLNDSGA